MTPIVIALVAALAYGLSDFAGGVASGRTSPWAVAFLASAVGGLLIGALALLGVRSPLPPDSVDLAWAVVGGLGNGVGTAFLYRGLGGGRMGVVSPLSGVGAALVPVAAGVAFGERPSTLVWIGLGAALPAIWLVSREPASETPAVSSARGDVVNGVLAGLGFGTLFAALGRIPEEAGLLPLALNQAVAAVVIAAVALALHAPWWPRDRFAAIGAVCGTLGAVATLSFLVATQSGFLTVTAVLASLYPGFTVLLAAVMLRERIHRSQGLGLLLAALCVALVAAG